MPPSATSPSQVFLEDTSELRNPIVPGFSPDPSVVLVDSVYYLVTSSFHVFPGIPIYASTDLKNWTHVGMYTLLLCLKSESGHVISLRVEKRARTIIAFC